MQQRSKDKRSEDGLYINAAAALQVAEKHCFLRFRTSQPKWLPALCNEVIFDQKVNYAPF